jgi:L-iditol 2-dehydrogenase
MYYSNNDVRLEEIPRPEIGHREILVKVHASGICGADVMEWYRVKKAPRVLGHEVAAEIVEVGRDVKKYRVGQRVSVTHHVPCNTCRWCLKGNHTDCDTLHTTDFDPGGFAEFIRVPELNVDRGTFLLPDGVSYEEGSFVEPLGCVVRAQRSAGLRPGQSVLVMGSGIAGVIHIAHAKASGAGTIIATDIDGFRLEAAKRFGADHVIRAGEDVPTRVKELTEGKLCDVVVICAGVESVFDQSWKCVDRGGTVVWYAILEPGTNISVPMFDVWYSRANVVSSYGAAPRDCEVAVELIRSKRIPVRDMITHRLPLGEIQRGFKLVSEGKRSLKVIVEPQK